MSSLLLSTVPWRPEAERLLPEIQGPVVLLTPVHCARRSEAERFLPEIQGPVVFLAPVFCAMEVRG